MSNIPVSDELSRTFTAAQPEQIRAILVQNDGKALQLVQALPPTSSDSTDKDDFEPVLSKLFSNDPQRSGYALFRLDSQAASGEWEWLCCAYQPDGAKIKEKMQYALTRTSLMAGLTERRFLDTIFGSTPRDFIWPTKLRNSRKHDYQNPQLKTAGLAASEAAGTGTGGAKRTFGLRSGNANLLRATGTEPEASGAADGSSPPTLTPAAGSASTSQSTVVPPQPKRFNSHELTSAFKDPGLEERRDAQQARDDAAAETSAAMTDAPAPATIAAEPETETPSQLNSSGTDGDAVEAPVTPAAAEGRSDSLSQPTVPSAPLVGASIAVQEAQETQQSDSEQTYREEAHAEAKAPSEPSTPQGVQPLSQPTLPASLEPESGPTPAAPAAKTTSEPVSAPRPSEMVPAAAAAGSSSTRVGYGTGPASGLTQREEELLELRKLQAAERASSGGGGSGGAGSRLASGGSQLGFKRGDGVSEALQGLASTASGTAEWNLVVLSIDIASETIELASPPRFVLPADLVESLSEEEPRIAFYRIEEGGARRSDEESKVVMLYCCPAGCSVKARMVYSSNVLTVMNQVKGMGGLRVVKKLESSDRRELSHVHIVEEVEAVLAKERHVYQGTARVGSGGAEAGGEGMLPTEELKGSFARPRKAGAAAGVRR